MEDGSRKDRVAEVRSTKCAQNRDLAENRDIHSFGTGEDTIKLCMMVD